MSSYLDEIKPITMKDKVLLRLRRTYTESEAVTYISDRLRDCEVENGVLRSDAEHYKHLLDIEREKNKGYERLKEELVLSENLVSKLEDKIIEMQGRFRSHSQSAVRLLRQDDYHRHWDRIFDYLNRNSFL